MRIPALTGTSWVRASELEVWSALRDDAGAAFRTAFSRGVAPVATAVLVGVQIRLWWLGRLPAVFEPSERWLPKLATAILEDGEGWRLLTMGFYHVSPAHIALNLLWLAYSGWSLERALGRANLVALYLASVLGGSLFSVIGSPDRPAIGASGGVFGLIAAVTVFGLLRPELLTDRSRRLFGLAILPYLLVMFASGLQSDTTDNWAHFGGLVTGAALAAVLDPPALQRRPRWNAAWQLAIAAACVGVPVALAVAGPHLHPLRDSEAVAQAFSREPLPRPEERYRSVRYRVPVGWAPAGLSTGDLGVVSTAGPRGVAVSETTWERLVTPDEVLDGWLDRVRAQWPGLVAGERRDTAIGGVAARRVDVRLDPAHVAHVVAAARGAWSLTVVWEVEPAREARLAPLEDRVRTSVTWGEPTPLVEARAAAGRTTASRADHIAHARQRVLAGEVAAGLDALEALTTASPRDLDLWLARVELVSFDPARAEATWAGALAARPEPRVITAVATGLLRAERRTEAEGLLEIAWLAQPGDRLLQRARRNAGLPVALEEGVPVELLRGASGARPEDEVAAWRAHPLDLAGARALGEVLAAEEAAAVASVRAALATSPEAAVAPLLLLKLGPVAPPDEAELTLAEEIRAAKAGIHAPWMPEAIRPILAADTRLQAWADALAARPGGG